MTDSNVSKDTETKREEREHTEGESASAVGSYSDPLEVPAMTLEEWEALGCYAVAVAADREKVEAIGYDEYMAARDYFHGKGLRITSETPRDRAAVLPGVLTLDNAVEVFETTDDRILELPAFPLFSKTAKIGLHSFVVLAADTGAGKSSLALNFIYGLNTEYPVLYFNLEMDRITILRRLVAIQTGLPIDVIEGYRKDARTAETVRNGLQTLASREPLQIVEDAYYLEDIEQHIKRATRGRQNPTIVIIDHALLMNVKSQRFDRDYAKFTHIAKELRRISRMHNIVLLALTQENREGKKDNRRPTLSSLKESGEFENSATHVIFLWEDPEDGAKKIIIMKNRSGASGRDIVLTSYPKTQIYAEAKTQPGGTASAVGSSTAQPKGRRAKRQTKIDEWIKADPEVFTEPER